MTLQDIPETTDGINIEVHILTNTQLNLPDRSDLFYDCFWERQRHLDYRLDDKSHIIDREVSPQDVVALYNASQQLIRNCRSVLDSISESWNPHWRHLDIVLARGVKEHPDFLDCNGCAGLYSDFFYTGDEKKSPFSPLILLIVQEGSENQIWPTLIHELTHFAWTAQGSVPNKTFYDWILQEGAGDHLVEFHMGYQYTLDRGPAWEGSQWLEGLESLISSVSAFESSQTYNFSKLPEHYKLGYQVVEKILDQENCSLQNLICMSDGLRREAIKRLALAESIK